MKDLSFLFFDVLRAPLVITLSVWTSTLLMKFVLWLGRRQQEKEWENYVWVPTYRKPEIARVDKTSLGLMNSDENTGGL